MATDFCWIGQKEAWVGGRKEAGVGQLVGHSQVEAAAYGGDYFEWRCSLPLLQVL